MIYKGCFFVPTWVIITPPVIVLLGSSGKHERSHYSTCFSYLTFALPSNWYTIDKAAFRCVTTSKNRSRLDCPLLFDFIGSQHPAHHRHRRQNPTVSIPYLIRPWPRTRLAVHKHRFYRCGIGSTILRVLHIFHSTLRAKQLDFGHPFATHRSSTRFCDATDRTQSCIGDCMVLQHAVDSVNSKGVRGVPDGQVPSIHGHIRSLSR